MRKSIVRLQHPRPIPPLPGEARCPDIAPGTPLPVTCIDLSGDNLPGRPPESDRPDEPP